MYHSEAVFVVRNKGEIEGVVVVRMALLWRALGCCCQNGFVVVGMFVLLL